MSVSFLEPIECYAAWLDDKEERRNCASGGFATSLMRHYMQNGGVAYSVKYDNDLNAVVSKASLDTIESFKGAKYVQANIGKSFQEIKALLDSGKEVLYIGTPCQVAGLLSVLKKTYENLLTCDLICHGVASNNFFQRELSYLRKTNKIQNLSFARFRSNDPNLNFHLTLYDDSNNIVYSRTAKEQPYFWGFLSRTLLNRGCFKCPYSKRQRVADITIGDFIGFDEVRIADDVNVSAVICNTEKGRVKTAALFDEYGFSFLSADYEKIIKNAPSLKGNQKRPFRNKLFFFLNDRFGYLISSRVVMMPQIWYIKLHHIAFLVKRSIYSVLCRKK